MSYVQFPKTPQHSQRLWVASQWSVHAWPASYEVLFLIDAQHLTPEDFSSKSEVRTFALLLYSQDRLGSAAVINTSKSQGLTTQMSISFSHGMSSAGVPGALLHTVI